MAAYLEEFEAEIVVGSEVLTSVAGGYQLIFSLSSSDLLLFSLPYKTIAEVVVSICNGGTDADFSKKTFWKFGTWKTGIYLEEVKSFIVPGTAKSRLVNGGEFEITAQLYGGELERLEFILPCKLIADAFVLLCNPEAEEDYQQRKGTTAA